MVSYTETEMQEGRKRADEMRRRFEAEESQNISALEMSAIGKSVFAQAGIDNIDMVIVYKRPAGWYGDLVLKNLPVGVPEIMGTPVSMPLATREEAENSAWATYSMIAMNTPDSTKKDTAARVFEMHGQVFEFPAEMIETLAAISKDIPAEIMGTLEAARTRMSHYLTGIMGEDSFIPEKWHAATENARRQVLANMTQQIILGGFRYPPSEPEPVSGPMM